MNPTFVFRTWSGDATERLKEMWWDGVHAEVICNVLGAKSVRAVQEKVSREGFKRNPALRVKRRDLHLLPVLRPNGEPVTIGNVEHDECRWMAGDPSIEAPLCGHKVQKYPFCDAHRKLAYVKTYMPAGA